MGSQLADVLIRGKGVSFFSNATSEQYNLSKELWDLLKDDNSNPSIDDIFELADYTLKREVEWITKSKERLSTVIYKTTPNIDKTTIALRESFEQARISQWEKAISILDDLINGETNEKSKGFLMQIKAEYTNFIDHSKAQQILKSARGFNGGILQPIDGIQYNKLINNREQAKVVFDGLEKISDTNGFIIHINAVLDSLIFSPNANNFEASLHTLGATLGFESSRPDQEIGKGPDNLWAIGNSKYLVIECKSGTTTETISKRDCDQLGGSIRWFNTEYGKSFNCTPIMIHNSKLADARATPPQGTKIITPELLDKFKIQIRNFATALVQNGNRQDISKISSLLMTYKLCGQDLTQEYTVTVENR